MKKEIIVILLFICSTAYSAFTFAETWSPEGGTYIRSVYFFNNEVADIHKLFMSVVNLPANGNCRSDVNGLAVLLDSNHFYKEIYSAMLSAQAQHTAVRFSYDICDSDGWPIIKHFQILSK